MVPPRRPQSTHGAGNSPCPGPRTGPRRQSQRYPIHVISRGPRPGAARCSLRSSCLVTHALSRLVFPAGGPKTPLSHLSARQGRPPGPKRSEWPPPPGRYRFGLVRPSDGAGQTISGTGGRATRTYRAAWCQAQRYGGQSVAQGARGRPARGQCPCHSPLRSTPWSSQPYPFALCLVIRAFALISPAVGHVAGALRDLIEYAHDST